MKKIFFDICYLGTIVTLVIFLISFIIPENELNTQFFFNKSFLIFRYFSFLLLIILWVKCLISWYKYDKNIIRLLMLFLLHAFFIIYYYRKLVKNNWL